MQITDVRVRKVAKEGKLKAVVSITMDEEFVVHDIKVIEGEKGLFIAMPSKKALDGEYRDIAHPINSATRERIQSIILEKYEEALSQEAEAEPEMVKSLKVTILFVPADLSPKFADPVPKTRFSLSRLPTISAFPFIEIFAVVVPS